MSTPDLLTNRAHGVRRVPMFIDGQLDFEELPAWDMTVATAVTEVRLRERLSVREAAARMGLTAVALGDVERGLKVPVDLEAFWTALGARP